MSYTKKDYREALPPATLALALLCLALLISSCEGAWYTIHPVRKTNYGGILGEIQDRIPGPTKFAGGQINTWAHEDCHLVNSGGHRHGGWFCYVPGGYAYLIPEIPSLRMSHIRQAVPANLRAVQPYGMYLQMNEEAPLVLFDELSAYCIGAHAAIERGLSRDINTVMDLKATRWFLAVCHIACNVVERMGQRQWANETRQFLNWMRAYIQYLERRAQR